MKDFSACARLAPLFLFCSALFWSTNGIAAKCFGWDPICIATLKGLIALIGFLLLMRGRKFKPTPLKLFTGFCYFGQSMLIMCANRFTTAANAAVLQNTSPLGIILLNLTVNKKAPTRREWIVCACLLFGVMLACAGSFGNSSAFGNALALFSMCFYACLFWLSDREDADTVESFVYGNALFLFTLPYFLKNDTVRMTGAGSFLLLVLLTGLSGIGAWLCFSIGIKNTSALKANFITMAEPVLAPVWTFLLLGERIGTSSFIGCAIVLLTIAVYNTLEVSRPNGTAPNP